MLLREGKIRLALPDLTVEALSRYRDSLIRVRGCLFPAWNRETHLLRVGEMQIPCPSVSVEEPAPPDPFSAPLKQATELLLFDRLPALCTQSDGWTGSRRPRGGRWLSRVGGALTGAAGGRRAENRAHRPAATPESAAGQLAGCEA